MNALILRISQAIRWLLAVLLVGMVLLNCFNIAARHFFNFSYLGADELQVFAMVAIAFLGSICVSAERQHLRMDILSQSMGPLGQRVLGVLEALLTLVVCGLMTWYSWQFVLRIVRIGQRSGMADIPMWLPHITVTLTFGAMALLALLRLPALLRSTAGESS